MTQPTSEPARFSKSALFRRLEYEPHVGQLAVHRSEAQVRVLVAGVRWGKSWCAAFEIIAELLTPRENCLIWLVAPLFELTDGVFQLVVRILKEQLPHRIIAHVPRERRITLRNLSGGVSELKAKSADDSTSLLGRGLDLVVIDEASRIDSEAWHSHLSQRLVDRRGRALIITTPRGKDWVYQLWKRGQPGGDPGYESWARPSEENPALDRSMIETERSRLAPDAFAQEYEGRFVGPLLGPCVGCGGPTASVSGWIIVQPDEQIPICRECEGATDSKERTVVGIGRDGEPKLVVVEEHGVDMPPVVRQPEPVKPCEPSRISPLPAPVRGWPLGGYLDN